MADNRTSVIRFKVHEHIKLALDTLSDEQCCQLQEFIYQCLLDGLASRVVKRVHLQNPAFFKALQGNLQ